VLNFVVVFAIWVIYFRTVVPLSLPSSPERVRAWIFTHYLLIFGAIGTAAAFSAFAIASFDDASATLVSYRLPLPHFFVMVSFVVLVWLPAKYARKQLYVHIDAASFLFGSAIPGLLVFTNPPVAMGAIASAFMIADVSTVALIPSHR
jgi:hypothetical protein